jgi:hypothetical protein
MMTVDDRYMKLADDTRTVLRAMKIALSNGEGRFESSTDIFYVTCVTGELYLFKADLLCGSVRLFQSEDFKLFLMTCLSYLEGEEI